jgi:hypothetical protein
MTLVSTRYTIVSGQVLYPLKILILPDVRNRRERFGKAPPFWPQQEPFKQGAMFRLGTSTVPRRTLFKCIDDTLIEISDH